jgi:DNA-directed RNA polymerase omega subunit
MQIPEKIDSKFRFVLLAAHRAEQMVRGARPKSESGSRKPTRAAMNEIMGDAVVWGYGPPPPAAEAAPPTEA